MNQHTYIFKTDYRGEGPFKKIAEWMNVVGKMLNALHFISNGDVLVTRDFIRLRGPEVPAFSVVAYVAGVQRTGLATDPTKPYVKVNLDSTTATQEMGPPPAPFPTNEEWYAKISTFGDIHAIRD